MKPIGHNAILVSKSELQQIRSIPIGKRVIREERNVAGEITTDNLSTWKDEVLIELPSEGTRNAYLREIAYAFAASGFWQSIDQSFFVESKTPTHQTPEDENNGDLFEIAREEANKVQAQINDIGLDAVLAQLTTEAKKSFNLPTN